MSDILGIVIQSRLDYVEKTAGSSVLNQVLQKLSEPVRQAVGEQVFLTNLYPFHLLRDLDMAIGESLDKPLEVIFRETGSAFADSILDRYFYNYVEARNPQKFLAQIKNLYPYLWKFGRYSYRKENNGSAVVRFEYDEDIHKPYCWFMQEFLKRGVEICGAESVRLTEKECEAEDGEACVYHLQWKK